MNPISVRLEKDLYAYIDNLSKIKKTTHSSVLREIVRQSVEKNNDKFQQKDRTTPNVEKIMLGMTLQILGLTRLLATQVNESAIKEAIEKSDKVVDEFYGST